MDIDLQEGEAGNAENKKKSELTTDQSKSKKKPLKERIVDFFRNPKKRLIFEISLGSFLILVFGLGLYLLTRADTNEPKIAEEKEIVAEATYQSVLDGVMVTDPEAASRHPLAIVVENDPAARPQSGLDKASIIYETVYDPAATTRFLALFGENEAEKVGPVRSARTFFVDWLNGYDAFFGHWGGNIDALDLIRKEKIYDLDEFTYPGLYWREGKKSSEHTGYTSTIKLREQAAKNNYPTANNFSIYKYKEDAEVLPESQNIVIDFSSAQYKVNFIYDKITNSYKRNLAGSAHSDAITKNQLSPKNIAVMTVARKQTKTRINESGYTMTTVGTGKARIFMDGTEIAGTWKKNSVDEREMFYDATGTEIVFNRGQLWIAVIADDKVVTVQ